MEAVEATTTREQRYSDDEPRDRVDEQLLLNWVVKAKNLLAHACGPQSQHFLHFADEEKGSYYTNADNLKRMKAVFLAAQEDFDGGYISSVRSLVQAEMFDSELEQSTELLESGYKVPSAVVAGTVLETALRELCDRNQIPLGKLDKMNADLAKKGVYNANMAKRVTAWAAIRNSAAHGKLNEFADKDVKAMIEDIERFLADHLS